MSVINGTKVRVHYKGTFNDGTEFDNSRVRGSAINFVVGSGQMISGFNDALLGMSVGDTKSISIPAAEAYGPVNPDAFTEVAKGSFPEDFPFEQGSVIQGTSAVTGHPMIGTIKEVRDTEVIIDLNHPLAGKDVNFEIELVEVDADFSYEPDESESEEE
jgi:FKBP-type peptidyl-prolyl cis-trans isomerase 2